MDRRTFLKIASTAVAAGLPIVGACNTDPCQIRSSARGLHFFGPDRGWQRTTAAAFHSEMWGLRNLTGGYEPLTLPSLRKQRSVFSHFRELNTSAELAGYARGCDLFVALAHPDDPASIGPALQHCQLAKDAGAMTVLLAAEAFPDPESDQTHVPQSFDRSRLSGGHQPDIVFGFPTIEPYMEMSNIATIFGRHYELFHNLDLAEIRTVFDGKPDALILEGGTFGDHRGIKAASEALRYVDRGAVQGRRIKSALISFQVGSRSRFLDEGWRAADAFIAALEPADCFYTFAWVPALQEVSDYFGVTALVTV